jgi:hypothetical protein
MVTNLIDWMENKPPNLFYYTDWTIVNKIMTNPEDIISKVLSRGRKQPENMTRFLRIENKYRLYHTLSTYLWGLLIYEKCDNLREVINDYFEAEHEKYPNMKRSIRFDNNLSCFQYYWFLICFFHDYATSIVGKNDFCDGSIIYGDLYDDSRKLNPIALKTIDIIKDNFISCSIVPNCICKSMIAYFDYRFNDTLSEYREVVDHGMLAGSLFYEEMKNKLNETKQQANNANTDICAVRENGLLIYINNKTNLVTSDFMFDVIQRDVATIIASHNVFFTKNNCINADAYRANKLDSLIIDKPAFSAYDYPLYFLFVLADTIDIYKLMVEEKDISDDIIITTKFKEMLETVKFETTKRGFSLAFCDNGSATSFEDKMNKETYWLPISLERDGNRIEIIINDKK